VRPRDPSSGRRCQVPCCTNELLPPSSLHESSSIVRYSFRLRVCQPHL